MIELSGISCSYGDGDVLSDLDLVIPRGASVAIIGPNGCGKSTLLKLLNGLVAARAGSYRFDGVAITAARLKDPRFSKRFHQRIGLLFQNADAQLFCPEVREEIAFGPRQMGLDEGEVERRVEDCLDLLGIRKLRGRVPYHLSEGEKRKVALAAALALDPEVLVLDEPMNGLDPRMKHFLRDLLLALNAAGKTLLCSTHDFEYVEGAFRTAVVLGEDHRLARTGPYGDIIRDRAFLWAQNIV
ncbi:MAG TPA: ABC transporter ATP-binding protein [Holophaga sp.]|nr:ABC transporter ATP-binding protein [Holophaga sp.]